MIRNRPPATQTHTGNKATKTAAAIGSLIRAVYTSVGLRTHNSPGELILCVRKPKSHRRPQSRNGLLRNAPHHDEAIDKAQSGRRAYAAARVGAMPSKKATTTKLPFLGPEAGPSLGKLLILPSRPSLEMSARRRVRVEGDVYRSTDLVTRLKLDIWILEDGRVVGTARTASPPPYPHTYAVPDELIMRDPGEPPLRLSTGDGGTIEFHIGTSHGVLLRGQYRPPA